MLAQHRCSPVMRAVLILLAVAACKPTSAPAPRPPRAEERRIGGLRCLVQRAGGAEPGERVALVLSLHPMGGNPAGALEVFTALHVPALVVAPCGGYEDAAGSCEWYPLRDARGAQDAADRVAAVLAALRDTTRGLPVVMGFSQGAVVALALAHHHPEAVKAVFAVAGALPPVSNARSASARLPSVHLFLGEADPVFPLAVVKATLETLRAEGYTADLRTFPGLDHDMSDAELTEVRAAVEAAAATSPD
jgi:phospholipase/carboxylesterase